MDGPEIAKIAALHYMYDDTPGISRKKRRQKFIYYNSDGSRVIDESVLSRIKSLAIPPAYNNVWISPYENGHIQATGIDSKNRKQYRYHKRWQELRQQNKFMAMIPFGLALPKLRNHIDETLNHPLILDKKQIVCAVIYFLDNYLVRIGNYIYEQQNKSYGVTTLRKKHLSLSATKAILAFEGKSSQPWNIILKDKKMIKILKKCEEIPGYRLFKYLDEQNMAHEITSQDVNDYLYQVTNSSFTAKDFRTWAACREMLARLMVINYEEANGQQVFKSALNDVATLLGHTPNICQKCYIYPEIINSWKTNQLSSWYKKHNRLNDKDKLLLRWLQDHLKI